jgi:hypothetical protein
MKTITVYEGMMCCQSGLCGPDPDQTLIEFNNNLEKLRTEGVVVERKNLSAHLEAFKQHTKVLDTVRADGGASLPITASEDEILLKGRYPTYDELKRYSE